ncbi:MAG: hypothetical protein FWE01_02900 [Firmicutes bacterium]|nr:hypothetical protein [Bacillota bacterium]
MSKLRRVIDTDDKTIILRFLQRVANLNGNPIAMPLDPSNKVIDEFHIKTMLLKEQYAGNLYRAVVFAKALNVKKTFDEGDWKGYADAMEELANITGEDW